MANWFDEFNIKYRRFRKLRHQNQKMILENDSSRERLLFSKNPWGREIIRRNGKTLFHVAKSTNEGSRQVLSNHKEVNHKRKLMSVSKQILVLQGTIKTEHSSI